MDDLGGPRLEKHPYPTKTTWDGWTPIVGGPSVCSGSLKLLKHGETYEFQTRSINLEMSIIIEPQKPNNSNRTGGDRIQLWDNTTTARWMCARKCSCDLVGKSKRKMSSSRPSGAGLALCWQWQRLAMLDIVAVHRCYSPYQPGSWSID